MGYRYYLKELEAGEGVLVDTTQAYRISFKAGAGATVTYSRVNTKNAREHHTPSEETVAAGGFETIEVDWPFYWVSVAGGTGEVAWV